MRNPTSNAPRMEPIEQRGETTTSDGLLVFSVVRTASHAVRPTRSEGGKHRECAQPLKLGKRQGFERWLLRSNGGSGSFIERRCVSALQPGWCFAIQPDRPPMRRRSDLDLAGTPMGLVRGSTAVQSNGHPWAYRLRVDRSGPMNVFESLRRTVSALAASNHLPARQQTGAGATS
jgi:hypothetical protein